MERTIHLLIMYTMLVLAILLFHKGRKQPRSIVLAIYAAVEFITNGLNSLTLYGGWEFFDKFPYSHFIYKPLYCLWVPLFYFYIKLCLNNKFEWNRKRFIHFVPFVFYFLLFLGIWIVKGNQFIWENLYHEESFIYRLDFSIDVLTKIQYFIYNFLIIRILLKIEKSRKNQLYEKEKKNLNIKWARFIVYGYAIACLIGIVNFVVFQYNTELGSTLNLISVSYFFIFFFVIFYETITKKSYDNNYKLVRSSSNNEMKVLMTKVDCYVKEQQMFLNPELNLQQASVDLKEKERDISNAINTLQNRNFKDYINSYRIEHACKLLCFEKEKPVFEVMYESGFNTKGAFNLAFKKHTGKTPTAYRGK